MPIRLYFVRHGQTEANRRHRLSGGSSNHPLTKLGISQAIMCRTTISHLKPDAIYCSPQIRACQTAEIAIEGIPNLPQIAYDDRLREREFGSIDGTFAPLKAIKVWSYEQSYIKTNYGEETLFEFELRIQDFLDMVSHDA